MKKATRKGGLESGRSNGAAMRALLIAIRRKVNRAARCDFEDSHIGARRAAKDLASLRSPLAREMASEWLASRPSLDLIRDRPAVRPHRDQLRLDARIKSARDTMVHRRDQWKRPPERWPRKRAQQWRCTARVIDRNPSQSQSSGAMRFWGFVLR